jgi:hypothetical protein
MGAHVEHNYNFDQKYEFTPAARKRVGLFMLSGLVMFLLGVFLWMNASHGGHGHGDGHEGAHAVNWTARMWAVLWHHSVFFAGISVIGLFFVCVQYVAWAGWSASLKRIPEAFGGFLPYAFAFMLIVFLFGHHDLFHWTHHYLYEPTLENGQPNPEYDEVLVGKHGFLNIPFYLIRMVVFFGLWILCWTLLRKYSAKEDIEGGTTQYNKMIYLSATFLVIFGISSSVSAWDWLMSIDPHWFSTLFGWYTFASWFVSGLAAITLTTILLKEKGYLPMVNQNHLHDLGKFMFAFSVFWTYLWTAQFLLIYYANIPEETIYFKERMHGFDGHYAGIFFLNVIINFSFPFLFLMTRDAKRHATFLKIAAIGLLIGHWFDFYLMIMPGVTKGGSGFGFMEFGALLFFASLFIYVVSYHLSKLNLVAKNHPMLQESLHHEI